MSVTVHLFERGPWRATDLLRDGAANRGWTSEPSLALGFDCLVAGTFREQDRPGWADQLDDYFDIAWQPSVSTSVVLLATVADRWFAVTFGQGRHLLRSELLVPDFGLRVTANAISTGDVRSMVWVRLDGGHRTHEIASRPTVVGDFGVDTRGDWIRSLGGLTDSDLVRGLTGSQSLSIDLAAERRLLKILPELFVQLLEHYSATRYREHFSFIDLVRPVHPRDGIVTWLDDQVRDLLVRDPSAVGVLAPAAQPGDDEPARYTIGLRTPLDQLGVQRSLRRAGDPLRRVIRGWDRDGAEAAVPPILLRHCLSAEIDRGDDRYVLAEGRWFLVDPVRRAILDSELDAIPELTPEQLPLPDWPTREGEPAYNLRAVRPLGALHLDAKTFRGTDRRRDQVEVCDLLTRGGDLVCVKKLTTAGSLSHLFSQGSVSARLFAVDAGYRVHVRAAFRGAWPAVDMPSPRIVYAIGTRRRGPLRDTLPFFSRINLTNHAELVRSSGLRIAVARAPVVETLVVPTAQVPEPRSEQAGQLNLFGG